MEKCTACNKRTYNEFISGFGCGEVEKALHRLEPLHESAGSARAAIGHLSDLVSKELSHSGSYALSVLRLELLESEIPLIRRIHRAAPLLEPPLYLPSTGIVN